MSGRDGGAGTGPGGPSGADRLAAESPDGAADARRNGASRAVGHPALDGFDESQIAAAREAVLDRVRRSFRGSLNEADIEDAAQDAWAALLAEQRETPIRDLAAFVSEVGWRGARGVTRRPRAVPLDPEDSALLEREDQGSSPLDQIDDRARLARLVEALEQLSEREREALRLWFVEELEPLTACERLGISRSAYFKRLTAAKAQLEGAMKLESHRFSRAQRRLISDYVAGIAEGRARARAERLIAADPQAAAMAREIRRAHEDAAVVLPVLVLAAPAEGDVAAPVAGFVDRARDAISGLLGRGPDAAEVAGSPVLASGGARGAGAIGAGVVAKAFGGLGAGGVVLGCVGGGAVITAACIATGLVSLPGERGVPEARPPAESVVEPRPRASTVPAEASRPQDPAAPEREASKPSSGESSQEGGGEPDAPAPEPTVDSSTGPEVQEFGVAAAGVPADGPVPDSNPSDGASAGTVRQEFGP